MSADLLPPNATKQERSISLAVGRTVPVPNRQLWSPWTCPIEVLPWLAWALSVDDWSPLASDDQKRAAVAESIEQHRRKGTPAAVRRALQPLGYDIEIDERTGTVYRFALQFKLTGGTAGGAVLEDAVLKAQQIALRTKNARSELGASRYLAEAPDAAGPVIAAVTISGAETDVTDFLVTEGIWITGSITPLEVATFLFPCPTPGPYGELAFSTTGEIEGDSLSGLIPPEDGPWVVLYWISVDSWHLAYFLDGVRTATFYATDGSGSTPIHPNPWEASGWAAGDGATGTPILTYVSP
jgi:phage tail P2-like protein